MLGRMEAVKLRMPTKLELAVDRALAGDPPKATIMFFDGAWRKIEPDLAVRLLYSVTLESSLADDQLDEVLIAFGTLQRQSGKKGGSWWGWWLGITQRFPEAACRYRELRHWRRIPIQND